MQRTLFISAAAHVAVLILLWQVGLSLSRPIHRGYPRLINATLVVKPASGGLMSASPEPPAAAPISQPTVSTSTAKLLPQKKTPAPEKPTTKLQKTVPVAKPSTKKQNAPVSPTTASSAKANSSTKSGSSANKSGMGSGTGTSGGGGGIKLDAADFPFPHYITLIQYRIESNWAPPESGQGQRLATVYFKIKRNGEVDEVKLEQSSGNIIFDQAAKRAIYNANPLPPLPDDAGLQTLGVHFDFVAN